MKYKIAELACIGLLALSPLFADSPINLRCEDLTDPLGIDKEQPRLSWIVETERRGWKQQAYRILVASSAELLAQDNADLWDSGKVDSDQSLHIAYDGEVLSSGQPCWWKVRVWDEAGEGRWSAAAQWSMGLLRPEDWSGHWIGLETAVTGDDARPLPARYLRKEFQSRGAVRRATAYVCGLGFFDMSLNGALVSDGVMSTALSDFRKAVYYQTFDLTRAIQPGVNAFGVVLGNGRFFAPRLRTPAPTADFGQPRLLLQIEIEYEDGTRETLVSDESWRVTAAGPIRSNNEYDGESYDARMEMPGWDSAGFDDSQWQVAQQLPAPTTNLCAQMIPPMRVAQVLQPTSVTNPVAGVFVVDFGENFYGTVRLNVSGPRGTEVRMSQAYSLLPDGTLKTADNRGALATDTYILKGEGVETWTARFRGQGMRRIQVTGFPGTPTADDFEGLVIHTDVEEIGEFECSNNLINDIHAMVVRSSKMFLRSVPLDPDRDERQAWLGDVAKDAESGAYNLDLAAFYTKFMDDIARSQRADGALPDVAMYWAFFSGSVSWPSVFTIIPDWFIDFYGDPRLLETHYDSMKKWVLWVQANQRLSDGTLNASNYGDWCDAASMDGRMDDFGATPKELIATAYHYWNCRILERAARRMGKAGDEVQFADWAEALRQAYNSKFFDAETATYTSGTQCSAVLALAFDLVPSEHKERLIANLADDILVKNGGHLTVGLVGMQWLLQTLSACGRDDLAWTIVTKTTRPSWGYMLSKGATTSWERWDTDTRDPGMNSEALLIQVGGLGAWFYQRLGGIRPESPGFKKVIIQPYADTLDWVNCQHRSPYGLIRNNWRRNGAAITMEVTVPPNTTAIAHVPARDLSTVTESGNPVADAEGVEFLRIENGAAVFELGSGEYVFNSSIATKAISSSPADDDIGVPVSSDLIVTFNHAIAAGAGYVTIRRSSDNAVVERFDVSSSPRITVSGATLTIDPSSDMSAWVGHHVLIDPGAITDLSGHPFAGITDATTWNFTTTGPVLPITVANHSFESDSVGGGLYTTGIPANWVTTDAGQCGVIDRNADAGGQQFMSRLAVTPDAADGEQMAWSNGADFHQVLGVPLAANTTYTLTVDVTTQSVLSFPAGSSIRLGTGNAFGTNLLTAHTVSAPAVTPGTWSLWQTTFVTGASPAGLGEPLRVELVSGGIQAVFDNVRLTTREPNDFNSYITDPAFGLDPAERAFALDPDGDGIPNGVEAWFGTHPGEFNPGLAGLTTDGTTATFGHPQNETPPSDLTGFYQWSPDLAGWYASGSGPGGGPTVTLIPNTSGSTTIVTANASVALGSLFMRAGVVQN
jgi:alpha-L-rhamnosidase